MTTAVTRSGYLALALGAGIGIGVAPNADAYMARASLWLRPITSFAKGTANSEWNSVRSPALTTNEMVVKMRDEGLPVASIADMSGVERKTVYAWLSGGAVRPHNQDRLQRLYALLSKNKDAEFRDLYRFWNRGLSGGSSLGTLLKQSDLDEDAINHALVELWPLARKQQRFAKSSSSVRLSKGNPFLRDSREAGSTDEL